MEDIPYVIFDFWQLEENNEYMDLGEIVISKCFEIENLKDKNLYINIIFTIPDKIREINRKYRNIDNATDVLSFPMLEKNEIENRTNNSNLDTLGDIIISIDQVRGQAKEYGHSFERELSYMMVHGFYHLMGYDHIEENDKLKMREKEEFVLNDLKILR